MELFKIMSVIVPVLTLSIFVFTFALIISPKLRGKFMSNQIKATKYMVDESKDDLTNIASTMGDIHINSQKNILDNNEEVLKDINTRQANTKKDAITIKMNAIKKGFSQDSIYCKNCGTLIDSDSKFCKKCGQKQ